MPSKGSVQILNRVPAWLFGIFNPMAAWEIEDAANIPLGKALRRPNISTMRKLKVAARVPDSLWIQIVKQPSLRRELATLFTPKVFQGA